MSKMSLHFVGGHHSEKQTVAVSAQKALQGAETETRELLGGMKENSVTPMRGH